MYECFVNFTIRTIILSVIKVVMPICYSWFVSQVSEHTTETLNCIQNDITFSIQKIIKIKHYIIRRLKQYIGTWLLKINMFATQD